ncbi:MAG TPA: dihydroneopterin aldolase [Armatimonadota bacterium]|jgi:dihydroneopterin aldolase
MSNHPTDLDRITLKSIAFRGHHGVSAEEQQVGGAYEVDVELEADLSRACASDAVADTVDYSQVFAVVLEIGMGRRFHLLEALAHTLADALLGRFPVECVRIEVRKLRPPLEGVVAYSAVRVTRSREG